LYVTAVLYLRDAGYSQWRRGNVSVVGTKLRITPQLQPISLEIFHKAPSSSLLGFTSRRAKLPFWCLCRPWRNARCLESCFVERGGCSCRLWGQVMSGKTGEWISNKCRKVDSIVGTRSTCPFSPTRLHFNTPSRESGLSIGAEGQLLKRLCQ